MGTEADNIGVREDVHVGLILDMESRMGKIVHSCILMAISDFYEVHKNYTTRIMLHVRDSKGEPLNALSAGILMSILNTLFILISYIIFMIHLIVC